MTDRPEEPTTQRGPPHVNADGRPRPRLPAAERRAALLDAAADVVRELGPDHLTMERLAERAGVNKALAYRFFPNRDAALVALYNRESEELDNDTKAAMAPEDTLEGRLRALVHVYLTRVTTSPTLALLDQAGALSAPLTARIRERELEVLSHLADWIQQEFAISRSRAIVVAGVLGTGSVALVPMMRAGLADVDELCDTFTELCLGAVEATARNSAK